MYAEWQIYSRNLYISEIVLIENEDWFLYEKIHLHNSFGQDFSMLFEKFSEMEFLSISCWKTLKTPGRPCYSELL